MSRHAREMFERMAARGTRSNPVPLAGFLGTLKGFNPADNTVDVLLPNADPANTQTLHMPIISMSTGPGYGDQVFPDLNLNPGCQVLVLSLSPDGDDLVAAGFFFNTNQFPPPNVQPTERSMSDKRGSSIKFTVDGKTTGDAAGGLKTQAAGYASHGTVGGNSVTLDDKARQVITKTIAGLQHLLDDTKSEVSTIAPNIGLGDRVANLPASTAAINNSHLTSLGKTMDANRLSDEVVHAQLMVSAGMTNAATYLSSVSALAISALGATAIPTGSGTVKIKT